MLAAILGLLGTILPGIAASIGEIFTKPVEAGAQVADSYLHAVTEANRARVDARRAEGTWGPLGLITFGIGGAFVLHSWAIVVDSVPLLGHVVGSWRVAALPGAWAQVEIEAISALFFTAPPAAAAIAVAKVFRR